MNVIHIWATAETCQAPACMMSITFPHSSAIGSVLRAADLCLPPVLGDAALSHDCLASDAPQPRCQSHVAGARDSPDSRFCDVACLAGADCLTRARTIPRSYAADA